jgi:hypothetical protein
MNKILVSVLTLSFITSSLFAQLDTTEIEKVTKKTVLEKADLALIEQFVANGVNEILSSEDFSSISAIRSTILAYNHSTQAAADIQYKPQFVASAAKAIAKGFEDAKEVSDPKKQAGIMLNLAILVDSVRDIAMTDLALKAAKTPDTAVRYWAVHALTNSTVVEQLNGKPAVKAKVIDELGTLLKNEKSPEIIEQVAKFFASVNDPAAQKVLLAIADSRIKQYESWNIDYFPIDATILKVVGEKIEAGKENSPFAAKFAQLFSYTIQRLYIDKDLSSGQKDQLGGVLIQTESKVLGKLGIVQTSIKRAIDKNNLASLAAENKTLFGEGATAGKFQSMFPVEFGVDANNVKVIAPRSLPAKPAK